MYVIMYHNTLSHSLYNIPPIVPLLLFPLSSLVHYARTHARICAHARTRTHTHIHTPTHTSVRYAHPLRTSDLPNAPQINEKGSNLYAGERKGVGVSENTPKVLPCVLGAFLGQIEGVAVFGRLGGVF